MSTPAQDLNLQRDLLRQAGQLIAGAAWEEARELLQQARELDPRNPKVYELLAQAMAGLGAVAEAEAYGKQGKAMRHEMWQRQVEAEIRGHHELMGERVRHEIP